MITFFYLSEIPSSLISFLQSNAYDFQILNFDSYKSEDYLKIIILLPQSYSFFVSEIILEIKDRSNDFILLNPNSVFWLNFINSNSLHSKVINFNDFKRLNFFVNDNLINLSFADQSIRFNTKKLHLTKCEFLLLSYLYKFSGKIVTRSEIMKYVWNYSDQSVSQTLDATIYTLRKKIDSAFSVKLIHTIYGLGYKFEYGS